MASYSRRRLKILVALLVVVAGLYLLLTGEQGFIRVAEKRDELADLEAEVARLEAINDSLRQVLWLLENDPGYLEKVAREQFGMAKPGERVYRLREEIAQD